ncbi:MAG: hypothetical protein AAFW46_08685 [Pseudomonadota bacterium]
MIASIAHKFVLLAHPKTGSTSLEMAFAPYCDMHLKNDLKHLGYRRMKRIFGDFFDAAGCEIHAVARDPIDLAVSWYRYRSRPALARRSILPWRKPEPQPRYVGDMSFMTFVETEHAAKKEHGMRFFLTADGEIAPIKVWRYEHLPRLHAHLCDATGRSVRMLTKNASPEIAVEVDRDALMRLPFFQRSYEIYERLPFVEPATQPAS